MSSTVGQVTDLLRDRQPSTIVTSGILTETGPSLPVTLWFSDESVVSDAWEEIYDLWLPHRY